MNVTTDVLPPTPRRRARFELAVASGLLAFGLFALPAVVFVVGVALLGPYGDNQGMGAFYASFLRDLAGLSGRAWAIAVGPLLLVSVVRLLWLRKPGERTDAPSDNPAMHNARHARSREQKRIEPSVSGG